jgi:methylmalonyl-CoA mutase N-terminal domain/subunit
MGRPKKFSKLNETFNLAEPIDASVEVIDEPKTIQKYDGDLESDYKHSRNSYYMIIEKGQQAISNALDLAQEIDTPRGYEVVSHLIKSVSDAADKLLDLQKKMKDIDEEKITRGPSTVTNNVVFTGTTAEALKLIKQQLKGE